jgi:DNA modification methylase
MTTQPRHGASPARRSKRTDERVRVALVSAERLLGPLPDRSIDLLITDPPYVSVNRSPTSGSHLRDWFADGLTWPQIGRVFALARRKLKSDGVLMAMTNNDGLREAIGAMERAGFIGIRTITWDRRYPGLGGGLRHQCEFIVVGRLPGSRTLAGVDLVSVAAVGPGTAGRYPTSKPDGLGRELAAMAGIGPGSLVVDPFCGSGALLVGAAERGSTVVAGDVAKRAVDLASARLTAAAPARSGKPNGSRGSTTAAAPARSGKPNGSGRSATATTAARPNGSSGSTTVAPAPRSARPSGLSRKPRPGAAAARARSSGSSRKPRPGVRP